MPGNNFAFGVGQDDFIGLEIRQFEKRDDIMAFYDTSTCHHFWMQTDRFSFLDADRSSAGRSFFSSDEWPILQDWSILIMDLVTKTGSVSVSNKLPPGMLCLTGSCAVETWRRR